MLDGLIIGSGPAGLTAAIYAKRAKLEMPVLEREFQGTGQISESERVENYPGLYGVSGYDLGEAFRSHALALGVKFLEHEVCALNRIEGGWRTICTDGTQLESKTILYAAGTIRRKLHIPGEAAFVGKGVSYCAVCDGAFYRGKTVAVVGGGDTALGDAQLLSRLAKQVYLIHRRDSYRANHSLQEIIRQTENIMPILCAVSEEILGETHVTGIRLLQDEKSREIAVDGVFVAVGSQPNSALLNGMVDLDANGYVIAGEDGVTRAPGLFAAGDVRTKPLRQVVTAAADGANAAVSAEQMLLKMKESKMRTDS